MGVVSHVTKKIYHEKGGRPTTRKWKGLSLFEPDHSLQISQDSFLYSLIWIFFVSFSKAKVDHTIGRSYN